MNNCTICKIMATAGLISKKIKANLQPLPDDLSKDLKRKLALFKES